MSVPEWQLNLPGDKIVTAREAFASISKGCRVFVGTGCGEPQHLIHAMVVDKAPAPVDWTTDTLKYSFSWLPHFSFFIPPLKGG